MGKEPTVFTVEVEAKDSDDDFAFDDLVMFHQECLGGRIKITAPYSIRFDPWSLRCTRCNVWCQVGYGEKSIPAG